MSAICKNTHFLILRPDPFYSFIRSSPFLPSKGKQKSILLIVLFFCLPSPPLISRLRPRHPPALWQDTVCSAHQNRRPLLAERFIVWIFGGQDEANEPRAGPGSNQRTWPRERKKKKKRLKKKVFSHPLKPVFSCTYTWNKSAHSLEQTLWSFIVLYVMDGGARPDNGNRWAKRSTIMPPTGTAWLDLESLWFGFEEQWHFLLGAEFLSSRL